MAAATDDDNPEEGISIKGPSKEFAAFCQTERTHRRNADPNFDPELFDQAVALVLDRLAAIKRDVRA